ncbi:hypothetical protein [Rhodococcus opacus]|uniref:hypothetical protein n=1 Tax=Rhodococcus opacus TaxID=37919 RepID=UPI0024738D6E|nr:hypothetical protein [Rhodococcus opacus]MDH6293278.1 hypothetical protein [Rhodococcus opacus]
MKTPDKQPEAAGSTERSTTATETTGSPTPGTAPSNAGTQPSSKTTGTPFRQLFADDELSNLRSRWDEIQSGSIDDPRECVQKADGLVADVVGHLTTSFAEARSRLEDQWARGDEGSAEGLRVALQSYREFFQRLLEMNASTRYPRPTGPDQRSSPSIEPHDCWWA